MEDLKKSIRDKLPDGAKAKARKNIEEGRRCKFRWNVGRREQTLSLVLQIHLESSLETLDFMPMTTVDYSGGIIISDWYSDETHDNSSIKITVRFLSNEISDSVKSNCS